MLGKSIENPIVSSKAIIKTVFVDIYGKPNTLSNISHRKASEKKKPPKLLANIEFMTVPTKIAPNIILDTLMANVTI